VSSVHSQMPGQLRQAADLETSLLSEIDAASVHLQRVDCLDEDQRAEVHTILEAMKHDTQSHAETMQLLAGGHGREGLHA
jgi:hypothetical protein